METSLFRDYILDDTLDNDTPNDDSGINDIMLTKIIIMRIIEIDHNNDDNDNNYDNSNVDQTIMIFQAMHFGESFVCGKAEFCESAQILICLHGVNPSLIYRGELRYLKNHRNGSSRSLYKIEEGWGWKSI